MFPIGYTLIIGSLFSRIFLGVKMGKQKTHHAAKKLEQVTVTYRIEGDVR